MIRVQLPSEVSSRLLQTTIVVREFGSDDRIGNRIIQMRFQFGGVDPGAKPDQRDEQLPDNEWDRLRLQHCRKLGYESWPVGLIGEATDEVYREIAQNG